MGRPRVIDVVLAGSVRVEHTEYDTTYITFRCGRCGHEQETFAGHRTSHCKRCRRSCQLDTAATGENVTPLRKRAAPGEVSA
jgi:transcription elongation factor Elf1